MKILFTFFILLSLNSYALTVYEQGCRIIGEDDYVKYSIENDELKPTGKFILKLTAFEDENCQSAYLQYDQAFTIVNIESEKVDLLTHEISYTSLTSETAEALNMMGYCDLQSWTKDIKVDVTGKLCGDYQQLKTGQTLYQLLSFDDQFLRLGKMTTRLNGRSENQRPAEFDIGFLKQ